MQAATFERLVTGQIRETVGPGPGEDPVEHYLAVLADKTGVADRDLGPVRRDVRRRRRPRSSTC